MAPKERLIPWLNAIQWRSPREISTDARNLIAEHIELVRKAVAELVTRFQISRVDAYVMLQTAGHDSAEGEVLIELLVKEVGFKNAGVRTGLITNIVAAYAWENDPQIGDLENPWPPLLVLYGMGYTCSFDEDDSKDKIVLRIGFHGGISEFPVF